MKVKMTSAKLKSWLRDAELVSSGLESGSMPIVQVVHTGQYHLLCTTILFILFSERGAGSEDKKFPSDDDHCACIAYNIHT